ncbi:MAG: hypothetical protein A2504_05345 [Bdellovibrionales bacterium RIFOXYD12_FULL_39_22]|nr:MAG: hypothetical protein A2385_06480 [Bdellovibrionales bacterium RIFOXYB1_FULL_39_21]OFZ41924.1 MAG: hypothetical protein A2485_08450 [Bdellovibrionales bacterium RIFOXYC12_FULL_39_17]OFZ50640.1 MAG: hypothetical protein A2404_05400 [Bdellovibrionales bacterium RIFOXYC1_FULL_39_130]OFZ71408.1 MAG: hypothetical protein A2451_15090 [Bdellovibrionales bacterium RIFOXYC2_FULL_39_8]OFZ77863.1 MAG: hypothetical protein A2560_00570 [Bdellovibrionales bacterium RIFOXYD1_FULL_39_84]OFZ93701.1 MAG:
MAEFNRAHLEMFFGVVRKYMQVRGPMGQKDLANLVEVGVSTMSRFLGQKTTELNPQLIAKIVAKLQIPIHEIIDFVDEEFSEKFVRLVKFYKDENSGGLAIAESVVSEVKVEEKKEMAKEAGEEKKEKSLKEKLDSLTPRQRAYINDFLNLDVDGRDLVVDVGAPLLRYIRQKEMEV